MAREVKAATSGEFGCLQTTTRADTECSQRVKFYLITVPYTSPGSVRDCLDMVRCPVPGA